MQLQQNTKALASAEVGHYGLMVKPGLETGTMKKDRGETLFFTILLVVDHTLLSVFCSNFNWPKQGPQQPSESMAVQNLVVAIELSSV